MKKRNGRLSLRRETLRPLVNADLDRVAGGVDAVAIAPGGLSQNDTCLCAPTRIGCETTN